MADLENTNDSARSADTGSKLATLGQVKNVLDYSKNKITELKSDLDNLSNGQYPLVNNLVIGGLEPDTITSNVQCHDDTIFYSDGNLTVVVKNSTYAMVYYCNEDGTLTGNTSTWIQNGSYRILKGYFKIVMCNSTISNISDSQLRSMKWDLYVNVDVIKDSSISVKINEKYLSPDNYSTIISDLNSIKKNIVYVCHGIDSTTPHPDNFPPNYNMNISNKRCVINTVSSDGLIYQELIAPNYYASRSCYNDEWGDWIVQHEKENDKVIYVSKLITGNNYYSSFKTACENAYLEYGTKVIVIDGEYDLVAEFGKTYLDNLTESPLDAGGFGVKVGNGMDIEFRNGSSIIFNYTGNNPVTQKLFSPIHVSDTNPEFSIKGAKIIAKNCRYCIHMEAHGYNNYYKQSVTDCILIHDNRTGTNVYTYACIGVGTGVQADLLIENNYCKSYPYRIDDFDFTDPNSGIEVILTHTSADGTKQLNQIIKNNYIDGGTIQVFGYRDVCETLAIITGNRVNSAPELKTVQDGTSVVPTNLINFNSWNNEIVAYPT